MVFQTIGAQSWAWAGRTATELRSLGREDGSVVIVPVGSVEQHGEHLPVATDTILVDAVAHLGAERVADDTPIAVTPPIWGGYSPHHLPFGGTITLEFDTLKRVLENVATSVLDNGFDALLLLNGHGGNHALVSGVTSTIGTAHPEAEVLSTTYFALAQSFIDDIRESDPGGMGHGGEFETSLMLHLRSELVDTDDAPADYLDEPYDQALDDMMEGGPVTVYRSFDEYSESGAIGDPALASAETGQEIFDRLGDELADLLTDIHERNAGED